MDVSQLSSPFVFRIPNRGRVLEPNCANAEQSGPTHGQTTGPSHCSLTAVQMDGLMENHPFIPAESVIPSLCLFPFSKSGFD